jgi:tetratricopeptide (TPR) repeat protein
MADKRQWQELCNQAWFARKRGDYSQAASLLIAAAQEVNTSPEDRANLSETLNTLANVYAESGELPRAIEMAKKAIEVCRQLSSQPSILLGSALMFLAHVLLEARQSVQAAAAAEEGAEIYSIIMGEEHPETVRMRQVWIQAQDKAQQPS